LHPGIVSPLGPRRAKSRTTTEDGETHEFRITLKGKTLTFVSDGETQTLTRGEMPSAPAKSTEPAAAPAASRPLRVNRIVIDKAALRKFKHHVLLPRGDFWYDKVSGAWGVEGAHGPMTLVVRGPGFVPGGSDLLGVEEVGDRLVAEAVCITYCHLQ